MEESVFLSDGIKKQHVHLVIRYDDLLRQALDGVMVNVMIVSRAIDHNVPNLVNPKTIKLVNW